MSQWQPGGRTCGHSRPRACCWHPWCRKLAMYARHERMSYRPPHLVPKSDRRAMSHERAMAAEHTRHDARAASTGPMPHEAES